MRSKKRDKRKYGRHIEERNRETYKTRIRKGSKSEERDLTGTMEEDPDRCGTLTTLRDCDVMATRQDVGMTSPLVTTAIYDPFAAGMLF